MVLETNGNANRIPHTAPSLQLHSPSISPSVSAVKLLSGVKQLQNVKRNNHTAASIGTMKTYISRNVIIYKTTQ